MTTSLPTRSSVSPETTLYDAGRGLSYVKPRMRGWMHLVWFEASLVLGTLLLVRAHGAVEVAAAAVYSSSVAGLFGASALYHRGTWSPQWNARLQRLDTLMIFVLIAGTATPVYLIEIGGGWGLAALIVMWSLTAVAMAVRMLWMSAPERLVGAVFIGLGLASAIALPAVWINVGVTPAALILAGGALYITGAISYHRRLPDPAPSVFGYHEVFHTYVCCAAACHYVAIAVFVL